MCFCATLLDDSVGHLSRSTMHRPILLNPWSISNSYARGGIVLQGKPEDVFALTAEVDRSWLMSEAYAEAASSANPFDARVSSGTDAMNIAKLRMQWNHDFGSDIR